VLFLCLIYVKLILLVMFLFFIIYDMIDLQTTFVFDIYCYGNISINKNIIL